MSEKVNNKPTSFSLDPRLVAVFRSRANSVGIGTSEAVRNAIVNWLGSEFGLSLSQVFAEADQLQKSSSES